MKNIASNPMIKPYQKFDDEFDTRYLDPTPQVNLVKVDKDFKTLM